MDNITPGVSRILVNVLQQAEAAIKGDDRDEALANIRQALRFVQAPEAEASAETPSDEPADKPSVYERLQQQRLDLFGAMAMVAVTRDSIDPDEDYERNRILNDTYDKLDRLGYALDEIACDAQGAP